MLIRALLVWLLVTGVTLAEPFPLELVSQLRTFESNSRPVLSPDGSWLVYGTREPNSERTRSLPGGAQIRKSWLPFDLTKSELWAFHFETGERKRLGPPGKPAIRPSWSPDGKRLAFYVEDGGHVKLWVASPGDWIGKEIQKTKIHTRRWPGDEPRWLDNKRVLVDSVNPENDAWIHSLSEAPSAKDGPFTGGTEGPNSDLGDDYWGKVDAGVPTIVDTDSSTLEILKLDPESRRPTISFLSPSGKWLAYLTVSEIIEKGDFCDLVVGPAQGKGPWVRFSDLEVYFSSTPILQWHPTEDRLFLAEDRKIKEVDFAKGQLRSLGSEPLDYPFTFSDDGALLTLKGNSPRKIEWYSKLEEKRELLVVPLNGEPKRTYSMQANPDKICYADSNSVVLSSGGKLTSLSLKDGQSEEIYSTDDIMNVVAGHPKIGVVALLESASRPADLFWIHSSRSHQISEFEPQLARLPQLKIERFSAAPNVNTAVILPKDFDSKDPPKAVYLLYPGELMSKRANSFAFAIYPTQFFASRGYAVIASDSPIGRGNPLEDLSRVTELQVREAARRGLIDPERVAVIGHSHGGYAAAAVSVGTDVFKAGVCTMGIYDLASGFSHDAESAGDFLRGQYRMDKSPWEDPELYRMNSPYQRVQEIEHPLLIVGATRDAATPSWQSELLFNAMKTAGKKAELAIYPGEDHVPKYWTPEHRIDFLNRVLSFLDENL